MTKNQYCFIVNLSLLAMLVFGCQSKKSNPLRVSEINPRYFTDNSGKAIYLTGSHTWDNLVDINDPDKETPFDYAEYLQFLKAHNHNFIRLWTWDLLNMSRADHMSLHFVPLQRWERTGEGLALDGKPKFDLERLNQAYFDRLRERVQAAGRENIYVSVMLFDGWGLQFSDDAYENHPFHPMNNVNELGLDTTEDTRLTIYELVNEKVTRLQERYIDKVIETVGDLDNVLYEISNENHGASKEWQYHLIRYIKEKEREKGYSHPVGMTFTHKGGTNEDLFNSPADWISPNFDGGYKDNPPAATGQKVIISDTDHLWGIGGDRDWVWKSFLRGMNPIYMDPYKDQVFVMNRDADYERARVAMGQTLELARKMDLINMVPSGSLVTSEYCLANAGKEYLVYLPEQEEAELDLSAANGSFEVTWLNSITGETAAGEPVNGGGTVKLVSPFKSAEGVCHLRLR